MKKETKEIHKIITDGVHALQLKRMQMFIVELMDDCSYAYGEEDPAKDEADEKLDEYDKTFDECVREEIEESLSEVSSHLVKATEEFERFSEAYKDYVKKL